MTWRYAFGREDAAADRTQRYVFCIRGIENSTRV